MWIDAFGPMIDFRNAEFHALYGTIGGSFKMELSGKPIGSEFARGLCQEFVRRGTREQSVILPNHLKQSPRWQTISTDIVIEYFGVHVDRGTRDDAFCRPFFG